MPELLWNILACIGLLCVLCTMLLGAYFVIAGDREDAHWPDGLDEDPTLDVTNGIGDSRPVAYGYDEFRDGLAAAWDETFDRAARRFTAEADQVEPQRHIGDSRPLESDRATAYRRWSEFG